MDWDLNADQRMIRDTVREFVAAEIAPHAADWDREKIFPADVFRQLGEMGLFGMTIAEERGGAGLDLITYCLVLEELARGDASTCVAISVTNSVYCAPLQRYGNAEQQQRFLAPCAQGDWLGAFCLSEPDAGSDAGGLKVRADRLGGDFVINGTKAWVTNGGVCGAMLVFAVTGSAPSWFRPTIRAWSWCTRRRRWESVPRVPARWHSTTAGCPRIGCSAMQARGWKSPSTALTAVAPGSPHSPWALPKPRCSSRCGTWRSGRPSAARSDASTGSRHNSRAWAPRSAPRACCICAPRRCGTPASRTPWRLPAPSCSPPRYATGWRTRPCRCTEATATSATTRWSASIAG